MMRSRPIRLMAVVAMAVAVSACGDAEEASTATAGSPSPAATTAEPSPEPTAAAGSPSPAPDAVATDGAAADDAATGGMADADDMDDMAGMGGEGFGEPADASEADRVIEVNTDNDLRFEPDTFEVTQGETITFVVANTGDVEHEFVLGDEDAQEAMAEEMQAGDDHAHSGDMSNAVTVHPGETAELTWRFTTPGTVLIGCHVPGHWEAGMRGSVVVS